MQLRRIATAASFLALFLTWASVAEGQVVDSFSAATNGSVRTAVTQTDGKILIGGSFTTVSNGAAQRLAIARFNADGSLDTGFDPGVDGTVYAITIQGDGKILVGGDFVGVGGSVGSTPRKSIARLEANGSVDATFNPGTDASGWVEVILLQSNGQILLSGGFTGLGGGTGATTRNRIGRLDANGAVDGTFNPGANGQVSAMALDTNGGVVIGGNFTGVGGGTGTTLRANIARILLSNGTVDGSFDPGVDGQVKTLAVQPDGQILVGGFFDGVGGGVGATLRKNLARVSPTGVVDSFDPGTNGFVFSMALQANGKILVGGTFTLIGGGGSGLTSRFRAARLLGDGTVDGAFNAGAGAIVYGVGLQEDGKVLIAGGFNTLGGATGDTARVGVGRVSNPDGVAESITVTGGGTIITWLRSGSVPELSFVEFSSSPDGTSYSTLGTATRVAGGWQLTGQSVVGSANFRIRARGFYNSGYLGGTGAIAETITALGGSNIIENFNFNTGTAANWSTFALPDASGISYNVTGGVMQFKRLGTQAVVFQETGLPLPAGAPVEATFLLGNSDTVRKRISVLIHDSDFSDLFVCTFWLPANSPTLVSYSMRTHTTRQWNNATISFYGATAGSGGDYRLDNVVVAYQPTGSSTQTLCGDATVPGPPGGGNGSNIIFNGNFGSGISSWTTFGQIQWQVTSGVFEFVKLPGTPSGVVLQSTGVGMAANQIMTATFQLGNSSPQRQRVTVILHDADFSDLSACTFWVAPGTAMASYTYRTFATKAITNATLSVYPATTNGAQWMRFDNAVLQTTPATSIVGTECVEPALSLDVQAGRPGMAGGPVTLGRSGQAVARSDASSTDNGSDAAAVGADAGVEWVAEGFELSTETPDVWVTTAGDGQRLLTQASSMALRQGADAILRFTSTLSSDGRAEVQIAADGQAWETLRVVKGSDVPVLTEVSLAPYAGGTVRLRFVLSGGSHAEPATWRIESPHVASGGE